MTSIQQPSQLTLPEIEVSNQLDWNSMDFINTSQPTQEPPPPPPVHQTPPSSPAQQQQDSDSDSDSITTGLTRALSLPRQLNKSASDNQEDNIRKEVINISTSNPSHLFWVPASQHPEIAPAEFEKYVDSHGLMIRKKSVKRRQSILSVYFTANDQQQQKILDDLANIDTDRQAALDALEKSSSNDITRSNSTINNTHNDEESKRKLLMRRSVSLHLPTAGDYVRNVPDLLVFDRNSSPLDESRALVPKGDRPLLRRGARTNFKRNSSVTTSNKNRPPLRNRKSESDYHNKEEGEERDDDSAVPITRSSSVDGGVGGGSGVTLCDNTVITATDTIDKEIIKLDEEPLSPVAELSEDVRDLCIATRETNDVITAEPQPITMSRSVSTSTATTNTSSSSGRKSSWSWAFWSDEKSSKKNNKIDPALEERQQQVQNEEVVHNGGRQPQVSKSSDTTTTALSSGSSGKRLTLSSLFSRKSKEKHSSNHNVDVLNTTNNLTAPKDFQLNPMFTTRLPLHVERAIYKLSHIKLANPRRPLHEQVLISNQMFWYLSVIATNAPAAQQYNEHHHQPLPQQQQNKKPRKLVKKQRPPHHPHNQQQKKQKKDHSSKLTSGNVVVGGFMANNNSREASTGFVVPENYLNPKYQQQQQKQTIT